MLCFGNPRKALSLGTSADCNVAITGTLVRCSSSVLNGEGSGASMGTGFPRIAPAEGNSAGTAGGACGCSMASRSCAATALSPESKSPAGATTSSGAASAWAVWLLSRRLAHLRKLACCAAGEGLSGLPIATALVDLAGCSEWGSCSGLLAS